MIMNAIKVGMTPPPPPQARSSARKSWRNWG